MPSGAVIAQEEAFKDFGDGFSPSGSHDAAEGGPLR